jgi:hypothetical protein
MLRFRKVVHEFCRILLFIIKARFQSRGIYDDKITAVPVPVPISHGLELSSKWKKASGIGAVWSLMIYAIFRDA